MRKTILLALGVVAMLAAMVGCSYDDGAIWKEIENVKDRVETLEESVIKTNEDIAALQTIVNALQKSLYVVSVTPTAEGYTIVFSDGTTAEIKNGKDGANGANAPVISVKQDADGNYYWTMDGEWLLVDGERVRANGIDGKDGANGENGIDGEDAIAPQVRINDVTKEWEISTDGGMTWVSTGVVAEGKDGANGANGANGNDGANGANGDSLFKSVDTSHPDYVIITLADGTELRLARYDESAPKFIIVDAPEVAEVAFGTTAEFVVEADNIADYVVNTPEGWRAAYAENILAVTAPAEDMCHYDVEGVIAITVVSDEGKSLIVKLRVVVVEAEEELPTSCASWPSRMRMHVLSHTPWTTQVWILQHGATLWMTHSMVVRSHTATICRRCTHGGMRAIRSLCTSSPTTTHTATGVVATPSRTTGARALPMRIETSILQSTMVRTMSRIMQATTLCSAGSTSR